MASIKFLLKSTILSVLALGLTTGSANALMLQGSANETVRSTSPNYSAGVASYSTGAQEQSRFNPSDYEGVWTCSSTVVNSTTAYIRPGITAECLIKFNRNQNGKLIAYWEQSRWAPATAAAVEFSPRESTIVHKSSTGSDGHWAALSSDRLVMQAPNLMRGSSIVAQYVNGVCVGKYQTVSTLTRVM